LNRQLKGYCQGPTVLAIAKALPVRVRHIWRLPWENNWKSGGACSRMVWWEQGATAGPWSGEQHSRVAGNMQLPRHVLHRHRSYGNTPSGLAQGLQPSGKPYYTTSQKGCSCCLNMCGC
jgi:hypothetical protein